VMLSPRFILAFGNTIIFNFLYAKVYENNKIPIHFVENMRIDAALCAIS
jgi:hypothetical protein